jgi:hypothetical protein
MELLGDMGPMESHFVLFGDSVSVDATLVHSLPQMYHGLKNRFWRICWFSEVTRLK